MVASKNHGKLKEMEQLLAEHGIEVIPGLDWPEVEETGETLVENALAKARAVATATGEAALGDDTGLEVVALGGGPGVRTARFGGPMALLTALEGCSDRRASFRTVVALVTPWGDELVAEGTLEGRIAERPRGEYGFGYDPVFEVGDRTLGELSPEEKQAISHRGRAVRALMAAFADL